MGQGKEYHPPFGEQDLSDDLFAEYLHRVGEGEQIDIAEFLSARGFSEVAVETFKKELHGYQTYRELLQARTLDGKRVGQYKLIRELGRGGMGRVYLAEDTRRKRQVAIKLLAAFEPGNLQAQERFRREYEMVASLHHPHIVPMFDAGDADGFRYYSMEYIPGFTLDQVLARIKARDISRIRAESVAEAVGGKGPLWRGGYFDWVCWVMTSIGEALAHAHRRGIIHRDIKPSNVLLSPGGRPYLFDFGLACGTRGTRITRTGEILGTPVYMAPEQIEGGKTPVDQRTDVYGLGVTLYELLTWQVPYQGDTAQEVAHRILLDQPVPPRRYNPSVPAGLEAICLAAIAKDPERRYPNVRAMVQDVRNYVAYRPIQARPIQPLERVRAEVKKHPVLAAAAFAGLLLLPPLSWISSRVRADNRLVHEAEVATLIRKGVEAFAMADWPRAEEFFNQALEGESDNGRALALRGLVRERGFQDRSAALQDYRGAMELRPQDKGIRALHAAILGDPSPVRHPGKNPRLDEPLADAWDYFLEGMIYFGDRAGCPKAVECFSLALLQDRGHSLALLLRGCCYQQLDNPLEARIDLTSYTHVQPDDPVGYLFLSRALHFSGRDKEASGPLDQAIAMIRNNYQDWGHLDGVISLFLPKAKAASDSAAKGSKLGSAAPASHSQ